jgi:hypothetical protein
MTGPRYETAYEQQQRVVCTDCGVFVMDVAGSTRPCPAPATASP